MKIVLRSLNKDLTVCRIDSLSDMIFADDFFFLCKTEDELSLVCTTEDAPENPLEREDGWRGFYIEGQLDFSMVGVIAGISKILAENDIEIFVTSTYNTDYILVKKEKYDRAMTALEEAGYKISK